MSAPIGPTPGGSGGGSMPAPARPMRQMAGAPVAGGMLQVLSLEQTLKREETLRAASSPVLPANIESGLTGHIRKAWELAKFYRVKTDLRLLECLRARRGTYSAAEMAVLQAKGGSNIIWMDITDTKARAASSWISDVLMPSSEKAWSIEPSPIPELPDEIKTAVVEKAAFEARQTMVDEAKAGKPWMSPEDFRTLAVEIGAKIADEALKSMRDNAARRAERMEDKIGEHMVEGGFRTAMAEFIDHFVSYPTATLKGPFFQQKDCIVWLPGWNVKVDNQVKMAWAAVNPFDCYPAPNAKDCQEGDFIERLRLRREHLYAMIGLPGYNEEAIRGALHDYVNGRNESWLWSEMERRRYENDTIFDWLAPHGVIDALHYWGSVPGMYLIQWGMDPDDIDPEKEYEIDAILIGSYVIRASLNGHPLKQRPYRSASFSQVPGAFWGRSLFDLIKSSQKMCNATACALADNLAMASGPMMHVQTDRLAAGYTDINPEPWKIYQLVSPKNGQTGADPGIGFFQADSNADQLMRVFQFFEDRADTTSGVPKAFGGTTDEAPQVARTLSILMNAASKGLKQAITNIDIRVSEPTIRDAYLYEMLYGSDLGAKGDCNIVPRGAAAVMVKDARIENRKQALGIVKGDPLAMEILGLRGYAEIIREIFIDFDLPTDKIIPSDDALIEKENAMQEAKAQAQTGQQPQNKQEELAVKLSQQKTQRDLKAATIQKDLEVEGMRSGSPVPRPISPAAQMALGNTNNMREAVPHPAPSPAPAQ